MKYFIIASIFAFVGCSSTPDPETRDTTKPPKRPVVSVETSGDLYYEEGGDNIQMDLFGNCAEGYSAITVKVDGRARAAQCKEGRYRYSLNLPEEFFQVSSSNLRVPNSDYVMKEVLVYHLDHKDLGATSYILIDRKRREVKSIINKQVSFEKIPTGEYEPLTQINAFGSCKPGTLMTLDITTLDRFGHRRSRIDEKKACQDAGGFYFLSQVNGLLKKASKIDLYEDLQRKSINPRGPR